MKYILLCTAALLVCFGLAWVLARFIGKRVLKRPGRLCTFLLTLLLGCGLIGAVSLIYLGDYYHADAAQVQKAFSTPGVNVEQIDGGYRFDGPGEDAALIFYPGAKVEATAYAPLLTEIASRGIDCFLAEMPFNMAILGSSTADKFLESYSYDTWIAAGHSMGGMIISGYASDHAEIGKIVLLAAYPTGEIEESKALCSIFGTEDNCLNQAAYESSKGGWPSQAEEHCIQGGNHAQFGAYGPQDGDGIAAIAPEEQWEITADIIFQFAEVPAP